MPVVEAATPAVIHRENTGVVKRVENCRVWQKMLFCAALILLPNAVTVLGAVGTVFALLPGKLGAIILIVGIIGLVAGSYGAVRIVRDFCGPLRELSREAVEIAEGRRNSLTE